MWQKKQADAFGASEIPSLCTGSRGNMCMQFLKIMIQAGNCKQTPAADRTSIQQHAWECVQGRANCLPVSEWAEHQATCFYYH